RAKITRTQLNKDIYLMEGVRGYGKYYVKKPIPVTSLKIGRETVMVDDPLQWYGMQDLARHCKGKVLIGGLGLGLILHALQGDYDTVFKYGASRLWVLRADALRIRPLNFTVLFLHSKLYMVA
ncbi:hypothetical protein KKF82_07810, partial [Patescibacteria group bacterium]|nr:hypothetical protein [Patescibacteria group bacterium]